MARARIRIKPGILTNSMCQTQGGHSHGCIRVPLGYRYQVDSGMAGETITHGVGCITGACPLAIPCAFAHSVAAAASIILRQGQERTVSVAPRTPLPQPAPLEGPERSLSNPQSPVSY